MNVHDATEVAFKNGYKKGASETVRKMQSEIKARCIKKGIFPAVVARVIDEVAKEILEGTTDEQADR